MAVHETSVNYQNLIRDLAEMYPFEVAEVVVVELIANSLDAAPTQIKVDYDNRSRVLVVEDDGKGMNESEFDQYHDFAAGLKTRGVGIGFAGVGAKVSFNIADSVTTETRSTSFMGGSKWYLASTKKLLWEDIRPAHLHGHGTRVEVAFRRGAQVPYESTEDLRQLLRRHYLPLLHTDFLDLYERMGCYPSRLRFVVNGQLIQPTKLERRFQLEQVREFFPTRAGRRVGYGILGLSSSEYPIAPDVCGVLLATRGKVIKADLFNQFPGALAARMLGVVEIPAFVNFLTTAKNDFITGLKHREFSGLYEPVRQEFRAWLGVLGVQLTEIAATDEATRLERELRKLVDDIPELGEFFGFRTSKNVLVPNDSGAISAETEEGIEGTSPVGQGAAGEGPVPIGPGDEAGQALVESVGSGAVPAKPISRVGRRGPKVALSDSPDRQELAWVEGNNVIINTGHPCYKKIQKTDAARRLHSMFAIGSAVQRFLAGSAKPDELTFLDKMMASWGQQ